MTGQRPGSGQWPDGSDDRVTGGSRELDAALASLAAVGDRERQLLSAEAMANMAGAAARERTEVVPLVAIVGEDDHGDRGLDDLDDVLVPTLAGPEPGHIGPPRRRRAPVAALAAAAVLVVIAGTAVLSRSGQVVVVQDGAGPGAIGQEPTDDDREARPVLDLGDSLTTTTVPTTAPTTVTVVPTSSTSPDPTTVEVRPTTPSSTPATVGPSTTSGQTAGRWLTIAVGVGATVELRFDGSQAELGRVVVAPGWSSETVESQSGGLDLVFIDGSNRASLTVLSQPGRFLLDVDHGQTRPHRSEWTTTYSLDRRGSAVVTYGSHGLSTIDLRLGDGWEHRVDTVGPEHLVVNLVNRTGYGRWDDRIDAGPATVDLLIS